MIEESGEKQTIFLRKDQSVVKVIRHGSNCFMAIIETREEKAYLSQKRDQHQEWVPLFLDGKSTPFADMHLKTYQVRLYEGQRIETDLQVFLVNPVHSSDQRKSCISLLTEQKRSGEALMKTNKPPAFSESKDRGERARQIYHELYQLAHHPHMVVSLDHDSVEMTFSTGELRSMALVFTQSEPDSIDYQHYQELGFAAKEITRGILCLFEQREVGPDESPQRGFRSIVFTLSPDGIRAVQRTGRTSDGKSAGIPIQLMPEELHLVNVFSFLSLVPDVIQTEFGSFQNWWDATGNATLAGIDSVDLNEDPPRDVLFINGLQWYMRDYEKNLRGAQQRTTAFREYIQRSGIRQVSAPQQ
jgi:hypothetical protein